MTRKNMSKFSYTAKFQSCRPKTRLWLDGIRLRKVTPRGLKSSLARKARKDGDVLGKTETETFRM